MIIRSIHVRNFYALDEFDLDFNPEVQAIVGYNGTGKTTLLRLLCGLAGIDDATRLVAGHPIGEIRLDIEDEGKIKTFSVADKLDENVISKFKKSLSRRVSFPITTWDTAFVSECDYPATDGTKLRQTMRRMGCGDLVDHLIFSSTAKPVKLAVGDGFKHLISMILLDSPDGVPMLLDTPEVHLSITSQRAILELLTRAERQLIYATHSPQMLHVNSSEVSICEMSQSAALDA